MATREAHKPAHLAGGSAEDHCVRKAAGQPFVGGMLGAHARIVGHRISADYTGKPADKFCTCHGKNTASYMPMIS